MEIYNEKEFATIILNTQSGDLEAVYNILAYYRMSQGYGDNLRDCMDTEAMCEKMFQKIRDVLNEVD